MKKIFLALAFVISTTSLLAQFTATGKYKLYSNYPDIDLIYLYNGITNSDEIVYQGYASNIKIFKFDNLITPIASYSFTDPFTAIASLSPENATGYLWEVDGSLSTLWVMDYQKYLPVFTSLIPENKPESQCNSLALDLVSNVPLMQYKSVKGKVYNMERIFNFSYNTLEWNGVWSNKVLDYQLPLPRTNIQVSLAPLTDTKFKITGDQFATDLMIKPLPSLESGTYTAVAINCHFVATSTTRVSPNEGSKPSNPIPETVSAPFEVFFESNANLPLSSNFDWRFYQDKALLFSRTDKDQRYTFDRSGTFKVSLKVSNKYCSCTDSMNIRVTTSDIQVPYVFTPNADGMNDEFRIAYKSITKFKCWVFNRSGQQVYSWTDPQKGWDGTFNGVPAKEGAYYYIIEAVGSDGQEIKRKGNINLLRGKKK